MKGALATLAASVLTAMCLHAQGSAALARRLETTMEMLAPKSRLESIRVRRSQPGYEFRQWTLDDASTVTVQYWIYSSIDDASKAFQLRMNAISVPTAEVSGIGDAAFIVSPYDPSGQRKLSFRRGLVVLQVDALGEENTTRFARLFVTQVDRSIEAGEIERQ